MIDRSSVKTCVITGYGINADLELCTAFERAGADVYRIHIRDLIENSEQIAGYDILAFPGGFSFGDHMGSGVVFANLFKRNLKIALDEFLSSGKLVIGICNGFQVLVKMGFLPNISGKWKQEVSLIHNDSGKFEDRWVRVRFNRKSPCVWTKNIEEMDLPVRHGEGKFIAMSDDVLSNLVQSEYVALRYTSRKCEQGENSESETSEVGYPENPNGSEDNIAGICDPSGRVLGLMPHPEAFVIGETHPSWTRSKPIEGAGLALFRNGVEYMKFMK